MLLCSVGVDTRWSSDGDCLTMKPDGRLSRAMRHEILQCLRATQQMVGAARLLGLGRQTLYNHVKVFGIVPSDWRGVQPEAEHAAALALKQASYKKRIGGSNFSQDFQLSFS